MSARARRAAVLVVLSATVSPTLLSAPPAAAAPTHPASRGAAAPGGPRDAPVRLVARMAPTSGRRSRRAAARRALLREIRRDPRVLRSRSFLRRAALVNFKLPITIRLRGANGSGVGCSGFATSLCEPQPGVVAGRGPNPNRAAIDLGASLGTREVDLGGSLAGEITFHDSYDGGALGNVEIDLLPGPKGLTSTSIPLLWNTQVTDATTFFEANDLQRPSGSGCGDFNSLNTSPQATPPNIPYGNTLLPTAGGPGLPGYPVSNVAGGPIDGYLPVNPGINDTASAAVGPRAGTRPGNDDIVGGNPAPFPSGIQKPGGFYDGSAGVPTAKDTVLRTNALRLNVATPGTVVQQGPVSSNGPEGSQNIVIGKSGGQANLFGSIPGKAYGIDVTISLATRINSILRAVDQDVFGTGVYGGQNWTAALLNCQQVWTGGVDNYIPGVRLTGNLKIAPGLTSDGHLRIAKATVASQPGFPARFAVAACLFPHTTYARRTGNPTVTGPIAGGYGGGGLAPTSLLPVDPTQYEPRPSADCNSAPDPLLANSSLTSSMAPLLAASAGNGYTVTNDGSRVSVAADLNVQNVSIDVLIGDVPDLQGGPPGTIAPTPVPTPSSQPVDITTGPDGALWFTEFAGKIGRVTTAGTITEFAVPGSGPVGITLGPDGNLWFCDWNGNKVDRITPSGTVTQFPVPGVNPEFIVTGPDGNLWFSEVNSSRIARMTTSGSITEFPLAIGVHPRDIAVGSDGNLWFAEEGAGNAIGRMTTSGALTEFPIPTAASVAFGLAAGPDGNIWFQEQMGNKMGRITPSGTITEFPLPSPGSAGFGGGVAFGSDGNVWFTEGIGNRVGRITPSGAITEFAVTPAASAPWGITAGPDGRVWFVQYNAGIVGAITP